MVGDSGWFTLLSRELNMTMRMPSRVNCGDAQALACALPAFSHLHALHLGSNHIADAGAAAVVQACSHHDTITSLYLHCNRLTSHSAAAIGDALERGGCRLQLLQLAGNMLGDAGARRIARALHWQTCLLSLDMVLAPCSPRVCSAPHARMRSRTTASVTMAVKHLPLPCTATTRCRT